MLDAILTSLSIPIYQVVFVLSGAMLIIAMLELLFFQRSLLPLQRLLKINEETVTDGRRPVYLQILVWTIDWALKKLAPESSLAASLIASMYSVVFIIWAITISRIGTRFLLNLSRLPNRLKFIDEQTVGVFLIGFRMLVWSFAIYLCFFAWTIDLTGWLASAGVLGIVIGFAAKDTLANLVAGLAILADRSYQVGDFIEINDQYRGRVTRIGMRATVIETVRNIQIAVPNSLMSNGYVVNESAGSTSALRVDIPVSIAYGSNLEKACEILEQALAAYGENGPNQETRIIVSALGESGIDLKIMIWLALPSGREALTDQVLRTAYRTLNEAGISIPFNQLDVHLKSEKN